MFEPAAAAAGATIVKVLVDIASAHGAVPVDVSVKTTLPATISAALGV
jgi:hypothetical protein